MGATEHHSTAERGLIRESWEREIVLIEGEKGEMLLKKGEKEIRES